MSFRPIRRLFAAAALCSACLTLSACGDPAFWKQIDSQDEVTPTPQAIASQLVEFDIDQLLPPSNKRITLSLPDGSSIAAVISGFEEFGGGRFIWRGAIEGSAGSVVTLSAGDGELVGSIHTVRGRIFNIRSVKRGVALVEELDPARFPREEGSGISDPRARPGLPPIGQEVDIDPATGRIRRDLAVARIQPPLVIGRESGAPAEAISQAPMTPMAEEETFVDVMIVYTAAVVTYENSENAVMLRINKLISDTTKSFEVSGVQQQARLAHAEQTAYVETDDLALDWLALVGSSPVAQFSELGSKRSAYNADIVVLLTKPAPEVSGRIMGSCGQASQMHENETSYCSSAFAVVPINCAAAVYSFEHELGHAMGADHNDAVTTSSPPFDFSRGYVADSDAWHTIMAYPVDGCVLPECQRIPHWSSPAVSFSESIEGSQQATPLEPTGKEGANNARALNETRKAVSSFSDECK